MTGHPHKGRRSEWRNCLKSPPALNGRYELTCASMKPGVVLVAYVTIYPSQFPRTLWGRNICPYCEWRGLAEKPE